MTERTREETARYAKRTLDNTVPDLRSYLTSGLRVLDVGCGPGSITLDVAEAVAPGQITGLDIVADRIHLAGKLAKRISSVFR